MSWPGQERKFWEKVNTAPGFSLKLDREVENHSEETKNHSEGTEFPLMRLEEKTKRYSLDVVLIRAPL
jgi:hypothetical protein